MQAPRSCSNFTETVSEDIPDFPGGHLAQGRWPSQASHPGCPLPFLHHLVAPDAPYINSSYGEACSGVPARVGNQHWHQTRQRFSNCRRRQKVTEPAELPKQHLFTHKSKIMETYQTARHTVKASIALEISISTACACACVVCLQARRRGRQVMTTVHVFLTVGRGQKV